MSDFNGIVCWSFKEEDEDLERNDFMHEGLVDKMGEEGGRGMTDNIVRKKCFSEPKKDITKKKVPTLLFRLKDFLN